MYEADIEAIKQNILCEISILDEYVDWRPKEGDPLVNKFYHNLKNI